MDDESLLIAGWYGKIPALGDFTSRRLPTSFTAAWDSWLQHAMAASRAQLGERWLDLYLTSPIWRFILMPQTIDDKMWAGILMPSVDKVGRYFPLTIAIQIKPHPSVLLTTISSQIWFASLEQLALTALNADTLPVDLDRSLAKHPFPTPHSNNQFAPTQEFATWWRTNSRTEPITHKTLSFTNANSLIELFDATAEDLFFSAGLGKSIWWNETLEVGTTQLHCFTGLPPENCFSTLLENATQHNNAKAENFWQ